jgi:hypothetical protein
VQGDVFAYGCYDGLSLLSRSPHPIAITSHFSDLLSGQSFTDKKGIGCPGLKNLALDFLA